jgi:Fe-S cluster assembly scaffold protein SufB
MLNIDVDALATVTESSIEIENAPGGITFARLEDHPRLGELVPPTDKFSAHNAALWEHGLLVVVPRGVVLERPLYVRIANSVDRGSLFWRLLVIAEPESRFTLIEEYASATPDVAGYSNAAQKTNAYQENRNLMLSETAHADSIPGLEILANDVRCTHGATLGQVDREQLFYAMARGLTRADAERLIVRGFFQDVLDRIELEPVREALAAALETRIPQG